MKTLEESGGLRENLRRQSVPPDGPSCSCSQTLVNLDVQPTITLSEMCTYSESCRSKAVFLSKNTYQDLFS